MIKLSTMHLIVAFILIAMSTLAADAAVPICPHVIGWNGAIDTWAQGAPWIKVIFAGDVAPAKATGARVFYRPYDADSNWHDDGNLPSSQTGTQFADLVWAKVNPMSSKPDAISYRNEFNWGDVTASKRTCAEFVNYYNRLRAKGYTGKIVFGSFGVGWVDSAIWDDPNLRAATDKADAVETHEYFDFTVDCASPYLCYRHRNLAINAHPDHLGNKEWFIGEFGSDNVCGHGSCGDSQCRSGWQDRGKLTASQYIAQLDLYSKNCHPNVTAVFVFQQGAANWAAFETMGTPVESWMKTTWPPKVGTISGSVKSTSNQTTSGATVIVSGGNGSATTDGSGNYVIKNVPPGTYTITASKTGYIDSSQSVTVTAYQTVTKVFALQAVTPVATISEAKGKPTGTAVGLSNKVVTASSGAAFWIEEPNRASGIKAVAPNSMTPGTRVDVAGILARVNAEYMLNSAEFSILGTGTIPRAVGLSNAAAGGSALYGCEGPDNIGLLVRVWGLVKKSYSDRCFIDDGTRRADYSGEIGLKILSGTLTEPAVGKYVIITGVVTTENVSGRNVPVVMPRTQGDVVVL